MKGWRATASLRGGNTEIAGTLDLDKVQDRTIAAALRIFPDAELVEVSEDDDGRCIRFLPVERQRRHGAERAFRRRRGDARGFARFCDLALTAPADSLERILNRPIYPSDVDRLR